MTLPEWTVDTIINNTKINSLEHVLTWNGSEIDKMIKTFRTSWIATLTKVEKNFRLMVGEAQIHHQTHRYWKVCIPPRSTGNKIHCMPKLWPKLGQGLRELGNRIELHVDIEAGIPLPFAIKLTEHDTTAFIDEDSEVAGPSLWVPEVLLSLCDTANLRSP
jgi:hypothetical protein